ncbi:MAG: hypothetical protein HYY66_08675, partial [Candidatus Tectomicrobia bacterium]|nr:hypothetical protein [Candidatus Tectomicrobia bacterium]
MATQNIVEIVLKAVDQGLQKGLKDAGVRLDDLDKKSRGAADGAKSLTLGARALSAGLNLTTVAVAGVTAGAGLALGKFLKDSVEEFSKAELADRGFVTALEQTAGAT